MRIILLLLVFFLSFITGFSQSYKKVKIYLNDKTDVQKIQNAGLEFDHLFINDEDNSVEVFINENEFDRLVLTHYKFDILIDDWREYYKSRPQVSEKLKQDNLLKTKNAFGVTGFNYGSMGGFYTLTEVLAELDSMKMLFPNLVTSKISIGNTVEGRPIYMVKISDDPDSDEDEPEVLYTALHHAREPESMMQMIYFMYYLLENYNSNSSVKYLVDNRELFFIPVVNPDGYEYNRTIYPNGGGMWRKNKRDNNNNGLFQTSNDGVDLNRNYGPQKYWNAPNGGSSISTSSETYRGTAPFSEPETQAIKDFLASHKIKLALNYHSFGSYLIFPYGALQVETPDSAIFREFTRDMTIYNNYTSGTDLQTVHYSTRGNSDDYFYDGDVAANSGKIFAMTPEVGRGSDGFWPHQLRIIPLAEENLYPNLYYASAAGEYIRLDETKLSKNVFQPAENVSFYPTFKNKGLKDADSLHVQLTSLSQYCIITSASADFDFIASHAIATVATPFGFYISSDSPQQENIKLLFTIYIKGSEALTDTINITVDGLVVPVELTSFTAAASNKSVTLKWNTATELNNHGFEIQRSAGITDSDNLNFSTTAFIKGKGTTTDLSEYSFVDINPIKGKSRYRLKQIDFDGTFAYSETIEINFAGITEFNLAQNYPNPFNPETMIEFTLPENGTASLKIFNTLGEEVATLFNEFAEAGKYHQVRFNASTLASGIYIARLQFSDKQMMKKMLYLK